MTREKVYLGDGAFAQFDGYGIELTTTNGLHDTNCIYLEPETVSALERFVSALRTPPTSSDNHGRKSDG